MYARTLASAAVGATCMMAAMPAGADGIMDLGVGIGDRVEPAIEVDAAFRTRGDLLQNLDLDRGLTPSGQAFYPVPLSDPAGQTLTHSDLRLRTDIGAFVPDATVAIKTRIDLVDNLTLGSTPDGPPQSTLAQEPPGLLRVKRLWAEAATPFGLLAVGRMASHWGVGMLTNSGDCADCETGDAADRIAFVSPLLGHAWAVSYDLAFVGPQAPRRNSQRVVDLDPSDDVRSFTFAVAQYRNDEMLARRRKGGRWSVDYGAYGSYRWQKRDVPTAYLPGDAEVLPAHAMDRGLKAAAADAWVRLDSSHLRVELEAAYLWGKIDQPSVIPGFAYDDPVTSNQWGLALETTVGAPESVVAAGLDFGIASGDAAPGFGAKPGPFDPVPAAGELDGPQANPPFDNTVNNFRFHPDYHVDRILFRELIGTVTDAWYVRPHARWTIAKVGPGVFAARLSGVLGSALQVESTPGDSRLLGAEIDPSFEYDAYDGVFNLALEHAALFPLGGLDNPQSGLKAKPAQIFRARLTVRY